MNTEDRREAVRTLAPFKSQEQIAKDLGVGSRDTIRNDIKILKARGELPTPLTSFAFEEVKGKVEALELDLQNLKIDANGKFKKRLDVFYAELEIVKLKVGTQPKRVDVTVGQKQTPLHYEFLEHISRLTPEQVQQVFEFADSLPRRTVVIDAEMFQKELTDGTTGILRTETPEEIQDKAD